VQALTPSNTAAPSISGTAQDGQTLTAANGSWSGSTPLSYSYQWSDCPSGGGTCQNIPGATAQTYVAQSSDVGETIKVTVTASNASLPGGGSVSAASSATAVVTAAPPSNTNPPSISGTAQDSQTLTASNGSWSGTAPLSYSYQWEACNSAGAACQPISGAAAQSYTLTSSQVGGTVQVQVTASNAQGQASAASAPSAVIAAAPPANTAVPTVSGTPTDGQTLSANNGTWTGTTPLSYTYQWQVCDSGGSNCQNISGATAQTYKLVSSDVGLTLSVQVTASNQSGQATATSTPTSIIASSASTSPPPVNGWSLGAAGDWSYNVNGRAVSNVSLASGASGEGGGFNGAKSFAQLVADAQAGTATPEEMSALEGMFNSIAETTGTEPFTVDLYGGVTHPSWISPSQWTAISDANQAAELQTGSVAQAVSGETVDAATSESLVGDVGTDVGGTCINTGAETAGTSCLGAAVVGIYVVVGVELYQVFSSDGTPQPSGTLQAPTAIVREYLPRVLENSFTDSWEGSGIKVDVCSGASRGGAKTFWSLNDWTNNFGALPVPPGGNLNNGRAAWAANAPMAQEVIPCDLRGVYVWEPEFASNQWDTADFAYVSGSKNNWAGGTCSGNGTTNPDVPFPTGGSFDTQGWVNIASSTIGCTDGSGTADTGEVQLSLQSPSALEMTAPTTGSCSSVSSPCVTDPALPESSWCTSGGPSMTEQVLGNCLAQLLAPRYANLIQHWNHVLDLPVLEGGGPQSEPTDPGTTAVPTPSAGETFNQYENDLDNAGFTSIQLQTLTAPEAEWGTPAGAVAYTYPTAGAYEDRASRVDVYVNPSPMPDPTNTGESDDPSCDRSASNYTADSSQNPKGFTPVSDPTLVQSSSFNTSQGPTVLNYGSASLINTDPLDFGGWGYWHILAGHGWSLADDTDTRAALEDPTPRPSIVPGATSSRYVFTGPKYPGSGSVWCRRVVIVDFGTLPGDPGPKGIITSYGADVNRLPAGYQ
jgi:hypothetical protein